MTTPRSILIVEDNDEVGRWLVECVTAAFGPVTFTLASSMSQARQAIETASRKAQAHGRATFDLALLDIGLPDGNGIELIGVLRCCEPGCLCVVTTIYDDDHNIFAAIERGADGYILKYHETERLVDLLKRIRAGEPPLSPAIARKVLKALQAPAENTPARTEVELTPRETEVLSLLGRGFQLSQVASSLDISHNTASSHVKSIYRKLDISNRAEAALAAASRGLLAQKSD